LKKTKKKNKKAKEMQPCKKGISAYGQKYFFSGKSNVHPILELCETKSETLGLQNVNQ